MLSAGPFPSPVVPTQRDADVPNQRVAEQHLSAGRHTQSARSRLTAGRTGNPLTLCDNHNYHLRDHQRAGPDGRQQTQRSSARVTSPLAVPLLLKSRNGQVTLNPPARTGSSVISRSAATSAPLPPGVRPARSRRAPASAPARPAPAAAVARPSRRRSWPISGKSTHIKPGRNSTSQTSQMSRCRRSRPCPTSVMYQVAWAGLRICISCVHKRRTGVSGDMATGQASQAGPGRRTTVKAPYP